MDSNFDEYAYDQKSEIKISSNQAEYNPTRAEYYDRHNHSSANIQTFVRLDPTTSIVDGLNSLDGRKQVRRKTENFPAPKSSRTPEGPDKVSVSFFGLAFEV